MKLLTCSPRTCGTFKFEFKLAHSFSHYLNRAQMRTFKLSAPTATIQIPTGASLLLPVIYLADSLVSNMRVLGCKAFYHLTNSKGVGSSLQSPMKGSWSTTTLPARLTEFEISFATRCMMWRSQHSTRKLCQGGGGRQTKLVFRDIIDEAPEAAAQVHFPDATASIHTTPPASPVSATSVHVPAPALLTPAPTV